jgi:hypothetical protein
MCTQRTLYGRTRQFATLEKLNTNAGTDSKHEFVPSACLAFRERDDSVRG